MGSNDSSGPACLGAKCLTVVAGVEMGGGEEEGGGGYSFNPDKSLLRALFARFCNFSTFSYICGYKTASITYN